MSTVMAAGVTAALVAAAALVGALWRWRTGRVRRPGADGTAGQDGGGLEALLPFAAEEPARGPGRAATLVQFSTEHCAACGPTRRVLHRLAEEHEGVRHVEIDLTAHPELARDLNILQTPTTLLFDGSGRRRGRIGGAPRIPELLSVLTPILEAAPARR